MEIVQVRISDLIEADYNPREISRHEFEALCESLRTFDAVEPIIVNNHPDRKYIVVGGHQRAKAARHIGWDKFPAVFVSLDLEKEKELNIRLNRGGKWDFDKLADHFEIEDLITWGFTETELLGRAQEIMDEAEEQAAEEEDMTAPGAEATDEDVQGPPQVPVSVRGDVWVCGRHRVMCGDSCDFGDVEKLLLHGEEIRVIYADPPYGMGKEADGVENDNIYDDKLLAFNNEWWRAFRTRAMENANAFIYGNADVLWRWWYHPKGLEKSEELTFRNEVVWFKNSAQGRGGDATLMFPPSTERALYFTLGRFLSAHSKDSSEYFEEWEPIRQYLVQEADRSGLTAKKCNEITNTQGMFGHWTGKSQWSPPSAENYQILQEFGGGVYFAKPYEEFRREFVSCRDKVKIRLEQLRGHFDLNGDASIMDVITVPIVVGDDRHGHATPKPIELIKKTLAPISKAGEVVAEPFGGSGSTMATCEELGRLCRTMEITPGWVDVIVKRWQKQTGKDAVHAETGIPFNEMMDKRQ